MAKRDWNNNTVVSDQLQQVNFECCHKIAAVQFMRGESLTVQDDSVSITSTTHDRFPPFNRNYLSILSVLLIMYVTLEPNNILFINKTVYYCLNDENHASL